MFGSKEQVELRKEAIRIRCRSYGVERDATSFLSVFSESDIGEADYKSMLERHRLPRRIWIRLQERNGINAKGTA
jgi:hypothetical protein